eukprot:7180490-Alexandrium_andersonii.AAC.1
MTTWLHGSGEATGECDADPLVPVMASFAGSLWLRLRLGTARHIRLSLTAGGYGSGGATGECEADQLATALASPLGGYGSGKACRECVKP